MVVQDACRDSMVGTTSHPVAALHDRDAGGADLSGSDELRSGRSIFLAEAAERLH